MRKYKKDGEAYYRRAIEVNANNSLLIDYLGNFHLFPKQMEQALQLFQRAHDLAPDDPNATFFSARGLLANGQYASAESYLEQLSHSSQLRPKRRGIVFLCLAQAGLRLGHVQHSEEILKQLASEDDSFPGLHNMLGALYQVEGKIPEAQNEYAREFQVTGDPMSLRRALYVAQLMRANSMSPIQANPQANPPFVPLPLPLPGALLRRFVGPSRKIHWTLELRQSGWAHFAGKGTAK